MANEINLSINVGDIKEMLNNSLKDMVVKSITDNKKSIENSLDSMFKNGSIFDKKNTQFDSALDWAIETQFRDGITTAMEELNFKELIATKCKEIMSSNNFIAEIAEAKVRSSLGLPAKTN